MKSCVPFTNKIIRENDWFFIHLNTWWTNGTEVRHEFAFNKVKRIKSSLCLSSFILIQQHHEHFSILSSFILHCEENPTTAVWFTNLFLYFGSFNFISLSLFPLIFCPSFSHYKRTTFYSFGVLLNSKGKHEKWIPRIELWLQKVQIIGLWIKTWRKHWVRSLLSFSHL